LQATGANSVAFLMEATLKILFCVNREFEFSKLPQWFADRAAKDFEAQVVRLDSYAGVATEIADADVLVSWVLREEQWEKAKRLRWIHCPASGSNGVLCPGVVASTIPVTNAAEVHGDTVAEHVMALMLAASRRLDRARDLQSAGRWSMDEMWNSRPRPRRLRGTQVLIVGMGAIGQRVAECCSAMGMRVVGVRQDAAKSVPGVQRMLSFAQMDEALAESDFVVLAVPTTAETRGMMNVERLARMKAGSWLINVGRGALVKEDALLKALAEGRPGGAALDVFDPEPLPKESPLWSAENVIITPHEAGFHEQMWEEHYAIFSENLRRLMAGKELRNLVDKKRGY
jgi:phosphoglycerate dehydrogenase-like enzyme